jgi:hypothetical protein
MKGIMGRLQPKDNNRELWLICPITGSGLSDALRFGPVLAEGISGAHMVPGGWREHLYLRATVPGAADLGLSGCDPWEGNGASAQGNASQGGGLI